MTKRVQWAKRVAKGLLWAAVAVAAASGSSRAVAAASGGTVTGTLKLAAGGGGARLQDVIVSIEGLHYPATDGKAPAAADLILDQKDLTFVPHVLAVPVGTTVTVHNSDGVLHNVHSQSTGNPAFNFAVMKGAKRTVTFEKPETVAIRCDVHSEMSAFILVKDNPFFARPDDSGRFTITGVPAGTYTVRAWHERAGTVDQQVTVTDGSTATVSIALGK